MKHQNIIILGAGIGGLTTAIALHQNGFTKVRIYERRKTATTLGAGFVLWANASKILRELGLLEAVADYGGEVRQMQRWTESGDYLGAIDVGNINSAIGAPSFAITRADFHGILLQKAEFLQIPIHQGWNAAEIREEGNFAVVAFDNEKTVRADLVLGADGRMNSTARKYVNGENIPVYQNFVNWIGLVESQKPIFDDISVKDFWGCGERFGLVPINAYKGYWAGGKALMQDSPLKAKDNKSLMLKMFGHWSPQIEEVLRLSKAESIRYVEVYDQEPMAAWHKNRVCVLGDAAHAALPTSGQGACQAIEDAWHLADCLQRNHSPEAAFSEFQSIRQQKTNNITMAARSLARSVFNEDPAFCNQRNANARKTNLRGASQGIAGLWGAGLPA